MKKAIFLSALLIVSIAGCKQTNSSKNTKDPVISETAVKTNEMLNSPFAESVSKINMLDLPLTFCCGAETYTWIAEYGKEIETRAPQHYSSVGIIGKLPTINNNIYIVYGLVGDIIYPVLYTYNTQGIKIDSLNLHLGYFCGADDTTNEKCWTTINKDTSIDMTDTTVYFHYVGNNQTLDSIIVAKRNYQLDTDGRYSLIDELRVKTE